MYKVKVEAERSKGVVEVEGLVTRETNINLSQRFTDKLVERSHMIIGSSHGDVIYRIHMVM